VRVNLLAFFLERQRRCQLQNEAQTQAEEAKAGWSDGHLHVDHNVLGVMRQRKRQPKFTTQEELRHTDHSLVSLTVSDVCHIGL
jgi:hypothetical protein